MLNLSHRHTPLCCSIQEKAGSVWAAPSHCVSWCPIIDYRLYLGDSAKPILSLSYSLFRGSSVVSPLHRSPGVAETSSLFAFTSLKAGPKLPSTPTSYHSGVALKTPRPLVGLTKSQGFQQFSTPPLCTF